MANKQRPRLQKFFNKIRSVLVTACHEPTVVRSPDLWSGEKQMEFDLGFPCLESRPKRRK